MSHRERQPWASTAGAIAAPPAPKSGSGTAAALRSPLPHDTTALVVSQWELLYRGVSPAQQADLLALARQQGLLYSYQLPTPSTTRPLPATDEPRTWNLLSKMLGGQLEQLEPVRPTPLEMVDRALDETQRHAVAVALATPDVCLIQGFPGTGKSRVIAEIVTQAGKRGDRVLLLAAHPAALDRVLEQVASRDSVCPIRCVGPEEHIAQLPPAIRALTLEERAAAVRTQTLRTARETRQTADLECARRRHEEPLWSQLEQLADTLARVGEQLAQNEANLANVETEVTREVEAASGRLAVDIQSLQRTGDAQLAELATEMATTEQQRHRDLDSLAALDQEISAMAPLASAKQGGRWWSPTWWKATFKGDVIGKLKLLQTRQVDLRASVEAADKRLLELADARRHFAEQTAAKIQARLQAEINTRQSKLRSAIQLQQAETQRHETLWDDLARQIDPETLRPCVHTTEAVRTAHEQWQSHRQQDEARCAFAREWAEFLESSSDALAARLPGYANLIAATPAALASDPHFSDAAATGGQFDLLVLDEADLLNETEFLKAARRARHWVLVGEPPLSPDSPRNGRAQPSTAHLAGAGRGQCFHHLWQLLHCDPSHLPYAWFREGQRLGCRLRHLDPDQRRCIESEPLADAPDVELRILALPHARPALVEVLFPDSMPVPAAKEFLFREMQAITIQAASRGLRWSETPESTLLCFGPTSADGCAVELETGVREHLAGPCLDRTCHLTFDRAAGWDRPAIEQWMQQHLSLRDLGRTVWLETPQRMTEALAGIVMDLVGTGGYRLPACAAEQDEPAVEFVAVAGVAKHKGPDRHNGRGPRKPEPAPGGLAVIGAGHEIDLSLVHSADRLPAEVRSLTPGKGFVNMPEARVVVRKLEELLQKRVHANGHDTRPGIAVIALYHAQAELIRQLVQQSPRLAAHIAAITIGTPAALRQREADIVIVGLTRSHSHRAVEYGEGPAGFIQALTRARRHLVLVGDPGNLVRRSQWRGALDHLDETAANLEAHILGRLVRYLQGNGRHQRAFLLSEGAPA
ncbi:MAG TPA: AAA domain-containing protein [Gemmataceae bacterium]|nr:AAA domain-containing protein [Gemmataceae bacterium]